MAKATWESLPFKEAIDYFKNKVNFPADDYESISGGMHARAFTVAGVTNDEILSDFRTAISKAIENGTSLAAFRKDFDKIVTTRGWSYKGERGWRSEVIFNTNLRMAYAAGRWQKIERTAKIFPYLMYMTRNNATVRPEHRKWHGIILPVDHVWWKAHFPPNGYNCHCYVRQLTRAQAQALLKQKGYTDTPPEDLWVERVSKKTGEVTLVRSGFDFGFDYNPGIAAWGSGLHYKALKQGEGGWKRMSDNSYKDAGRPLKLPLFDTDIKPMEQLKNSDETVAWLRDKFGDDKTFEFKQGDFSHSVMINAETLGRHIDINRTRYLPFLEDTLTDPFEVWASFEESKSTGKVALRYTYVKAYAGGKGLLCAFDASDGFLTGWTFHPASDLRSLQKKRYGTLLFGK